VHTDSRLLRRLAIVGLSALSLAAACALAYWQWERYSSAGGNLQNLGYVLQWPLFGLFPAFVFWRIRRLSRLGKRAETDKTDDSHHARRRRVADRTATRRGAASRAARSPISRTAAVSAQQSTRGPRPTEDPEDEELAAYNRYLAELNARDQHTD